MRAVAGRGAATSVGAAVRFEVARFEVGGFGVAGFGVAGFEVARFVDVLDFVVGGFEVARLGVAGFDVGDVEVDRFRAGRLAGRSALPAAGRGAGAADSGTVP
jgi:hypothetical protein